MSRKVEAIQLHLAEIGKLPKEAYLVRKNAVIYPDHFGRGVLQGNVSADRLSEKIHGLQGYKSREEVSLYFDRKQRALPAGTLFGAFSKDAKKVKIKNPEVIS